MKANAESRKSNWKKKNERIEQKDVVSITPHEKKKKIRRMGQKVKPYAQIKQAHRYSFSECSNTFFVVPIPFMEENPPNTYRKCGEKIKIHGLKRRIRLLPFIQISLYLLLLLFFFFTLGITATVSPARTRKTKQQEVVQFHRHFPFSSFLVFFHRPYFFCVWQTLGGAIAAYRMTPVTKDDPCPSVSTYFTWLLSLFIVLLGTPEYLRLREATFPFKAAT